MFLCASKCSLNCTLNAKEPETKKKSCHILKYSEIVFLTRAEGKSPKKEVVRVWGDELGIYERVEGG